MTSLKVFLSIVLCVLLYCIAVAGQCPVNSDRSFDRAKLLEEIEENLEVSDVLDSRKQFFVYDLTDPSNYYKSPDDCINFIDNHIYHFSLVDLEQSNSHIAVLKDGKMDVFKSVNCVNGENNLSEVIRYVEKNLKGRISEESLTRLKNYRRYGFYRTIDGYRAGCNFDVDRPKNLDERYDRDEILSRFSEVLKNSVSRDVLDQLSPYFLFLVEESRANGFFVWDLTEPTNKQTSLLERVEFKNNHIYHFAFIDSPFSFSNIAVLEEGKLKIFKNINCPGKGDNSEEIIRYLNQTLKSEKDKNKLLKRVSDYRKFGVYASFNGSSTPQCERVVSAGR